MPTLNVAVIVVNYNSGDLLARCLSAIAAQTTAPKRVLVIDNGSSDGAVAACEQKFPAVEFHRMNSNLGFAKANNIAAELATGCDWLALVNPDAFAAPTWLEEFRKGAEVHSSYRMFACCMISDSNRQLADGAGDLYRTDGIAWARHQGMPLASLENTEVEVFAPSGGAAFYHRDTFLASGGFDERYFCYYEDVDLGFRLRLLGHRCLYLPKAIVFHLGSAITGRSSDFTVYHANRNIVWTYVKNMPAPYFWYYLPSHVFANLVMLLLFAAKGRLRVIAKAKWHAVLGLRSMVTSRKDIQKNRSVSPGDVLRSMSRDGGVRSVFRKTRRLLLSVLRGH